MGSAIFGHFMPCNVSTLSYPATRGLMSPNLGVVLSQQRLATDSVGTYVLTLTNLVSGSAIMVEGKDDSALIEYRVAASSSEVFNVPVYGAGGQSNILRIKVRKGTAAPKYQPFETIATARVGSESIYINQVITNFGRRCF